MHSCIPWFSKSKSENSFLIESGKLSKKLKCELWVEIVDKYIVGPKRNVIRMKSN